MLSSKSYLPKAIANNPLYVEVCDTIDKVIADNEYEFRDILNKYKDYSNQQGQAVQETLKEFGFESLLKILDLPDTTSARLGYFLNAISLLKGHKEGLILVTRLLGGNAQISEWYDNWKGHSVNSIFPTDPDWVSSVAYSLNDTVVGDCPVSTPAIEYMYRAVTVAAPGLSGLVMPMWPQFLGEQVIDNDIVWENVGKAPKIEYWQPNKIYKAKQHVISNNPTRFIAMPNGSTNIDPPNSSYSVTHNTQGRHYIFECSIAGASGAAEPVWDLSIGNNTVDNTVTWVTLDPEAYFTFNITWSFPSAFTVPNTFNYFREFVRDYVYPTLTFWIIAPMGAFQFSNYHLWHPNVPCYLGKLVYPTSGHFHLRSYPAGKAFIYKCKTLVVSDTGAVEPVWPVVLGDTVLDTNGNTWECTPMIAQNGFGFSDWHLTNGTTINIWASLTPYVIGNIVVPSNNNTFAYKCIFAGTSDITEPQISNPVPNPWPLIIGDTVTDGTVIWECIDVGGRLAYLF